MHHREVDSLMKALAPVIGDFVSKAIAPLREENSRLSSSIVEMQKRFDDLPTNNGPDELLILRVVREEVSKIPAPENGKDADPEVIADLVNKAVAELPPAKPGKDADMEAVGRMVDEAVKAAVPVIDVEGIIETVKASATETIAATIDALPKPKDGEPGKSVTVEQVEPILSELVSAAVAKLPTAKDGIGLAGALIDRDGQLVLTLTDGTQRELGIVVGKDADSDDMARIIKEEVAKIPTPRDGIDGFGFDDLDVTYDGERDFALKFAKGERVKEFSFSLPIVLERGVWKEGDWKKGDGVTWGGSFWIANCDTTDKPEGSDNWRLSVKKGRKGESAYDIARKCGFRGSESEWLETLRAKPVPPVKVT